MVAASNTPKKEINKDIEVGETKELLEADNNDDNDEKKAKEEEKVEEKKEAKDEEEVKTEGKQEDDDNDEEKPKKEEEEKEKEKEESQKGSGSDDGGDEEKRPKSPVKPCTAETCPVLRMKADLARRWAALDSQKKCGLCGIVAGVKLLLLIIIIIALCTPGGWTNEAKITGDTIQTHTTCGPVTGSVDEYDQFSFRCVI